MGFAAKQYVDNLLKGFVEDPPESEFQRGFLTAVLAIRREALGFADDGVALKAAELLEPRDAEALN